MKQESLPIGGIENRVSVLENQVRNSWTHTFGSTITYIGVYLGTQLLTHYIELNIDTNQYDVTPNITGAYIFINSAWKQIEYVGLDTSGLRCRIRCKNLSSVPITPEDGKSYYYYFTGSLSITPK